MTRPVSLPENNPVWIRNITARNDCLNELSSALQWRRLPVKDPVWIVGDKWYPLFTKVGLNIQQKTAPVIGGGSINCGIVFLNLFPR